jgi:hypothetical protein
MSLAIASSSFPSRVWLRLAQRTWLAVGLAVTARTLVRPASHTVFPLLALGASHWWQDFPLYQKYPPHDYFRYSPALAVALTPLAGLGLVAGGVAWAWLNLAAYAAGLWRCRRDVLPGEWSDTRVAAFFVLALVGALRGLWNGQSNALVIGLVLLAASALARHRQWTAAWLLAAAIHAKLTPIILAGLLCVRWPRLAPRLAACVLGLGLGVFLTRPPEVVAGQYAGWVRHLAATADERWPGFRDGWTAWLALRHQVTGGVVDLEAPLDAPVYRLVQVATGLGLLAWCLAWRREPDERAWLAQALGLGAAWLMLFGPAAEHATFAFLAPFLAWAFVQRNRWTGGRWLIEASALLILVLGWGALSRPLVPALPLVLAILPAGTFLLALGLLRGEEKQRGRRPLLNEDHAAGGRTWAERMDSRRA